MDNIQESISYIRNRYDSQDYIYGLLYNIREKNGDKAEKIAYEYFSGVYEWLYHDIILKKISIWLETRKLLESLSIPKNK